MAITQANSVCPAILLSYQEAHEINNIADITDPVGLTDSLFDPTNRAAVRQEVLGLDADNGHVKSVRIWRKQRQIVTDTAAVKSCPITGTEKPIFEEVITPTLYREISLKVSETAIRKLCDQYSKLVRVPGARIGDNRANAQPLAIMAEMYNELGIDFNALRRAINIDLLTAAATKFGTWKGGALSKSFPVYRSVDGAAGSIGSPIMDGFNIFMQEIRRTGFNGKPLVVGEGIFDRSNMSLQVGCCNNGGTDFGQMNESAMYKFYRDIDVTTGTGSADGLIVYMPGSLAFISYNEYVGSFASKIGNMERGTIADPMTPGLTYDLRISPDECGEAYVLTMGLRFDLYAAPTTLFKVGDTLAGVNGVFKALATGI